MWDSKLNSNLESISIDYGNIMQSDEVLIQWLNLLHEKGFSIVKNSPTENKSEIDILFIKFILLIINKKILLYNNINYNNIFFIY